VSHDKETFGAFLDGGERSVQASAKALLFLKNPVVVEKLPRANLAKTKLR
jgi:hypothetical protein